MSADYSKPRATIAALAFAHAAPKPLTAAQRTLLTEAATKGFVSPWSYGSATVSTCKKLGFIVREDSPQSVGGVRCYLLTDAGRAAIGVVPA